MSSSMTGIAIETIVWSMKVIETAKIIAMRVSFLFVAVLIRGLRCCELVR